MISVGQARHMYACAEARFTIDTTHICIAPQLNLSGHHRHHTVS